MSLSSNEKSANPAKKFFEWKGGLGVWQYYDKDAGKNIQVDEKMYIVPLDELSTIKGWHDASQSGIYSNEIKKIKEEEISVRSFKGGEIIKGFYNDIKGRLEGGKFCKSVYAALLDSKGNVIEMVNFGFMGSSLGSWIDAKVNISEGKIIVLSKNPEKQKKGSTEYYIPNVTITKKRDDILEECKQMDEDLKSYIGRYKQESQEPLTHTPPQPVVTSAAPVVEVEDEIDELPF